MLPPPMVSAICTPRSTTSFTSWAMAVSVLGEMPYLPSPMSASPESFRRIRLYLDFCFSARSLGMVSRADLLAWEVRLRVRGILPELAGALALKRRAGRRPGRGCAAGGVFPRVGGGGAGRARRE